MSRLAPVVAGFAILVLLSRAFPQSSGEAVFNGNCAHCHGKDGAGKTAAASRFHIPDLGSPAVQSMSDAELYDSIARGTHHKEYPHAFEFRGVSPAEIKALVKHIRGFAKK